MSTPLKVLVVEDSEDDSLLMIRKLEHGGYNPVFERVETAQAMTAALKKQVWDIILSDYSLPHFSAPESLRLLQQSGLDLPFIIVSGSIGEETAVAAMKAGAHDYLMKDNLKRLAPAVERELREAESRRERKQVEHDIGERVKELTCLYGISQLMAKTGTSLDEILKGTVELIPPGWQYPEITCARITSDGKELKTDNFALTEWKQTSDIKVGGETLGILEVYYLEEKPESDEGSFLKEERNLINGIARMLDEKIERKQAQEALEESQEKLQRMFESVADGITISDLNGVIANANERTVEMLRLGSKEK